MITIRRSDERGHAQRGWLDSRHTFSFADYHDAKHMGFRHLRVINEDHVQAGQGFGTHPHRDMEILSYVVAGRLAHRDSMGHVREVGAGQVQMMSAGTGVTHSEYNPLPDESVHFLQIWIVPSQNGIAPRYAEWQSKNDEPLQLIAAPDAPDGSLPIAQNARVWLVRLSPNQTLDHALETQQAAWLQVIKGEVTVNDQTLSSGDGVSLENESSLSLRAETALEALLFVMD